MAFCENCGTQIPEGQSFCPNCGTPVKASETPAEQPAAEQNNVADQPAAAEGSAEESAQPAVTESGAEQSAQPAETVNTVEQQTAPQYTAPQPDTAPEASNAGKPFHITSLVLGILSLILSLFPLGMASIIPLIMGVVGIVMYVVGKKRGTRSGAGTAGLVTSILGVILAGITFVACVACQGALGCGTRMVGQAVEDAIGGVTQDFADQYGDLGNLIEEFTDAL